MFNKSHLNNFKLCVLLQFIFSSERAHKRKRSIIQESNIDLLLLKTRFHTQDAKLECENMMETEDASKKPQEPSHVTLPSFASLVKYLKHHSKKNKNNLIANIDKNKDNAFLKKQNEINSCLSSHIEENNKINNLIQKLNEYKSTLKSSYILSEPLLLFTDEEVNNITLIINPINNQIFTFCSENFIYKIILKNLEIITENTKTPIFNKNGLKKIEHERILIYIIVPIIRLRYIFNFLNISYTGYEIDIISLISEILKFKITLEDLNKKCKYNKRYKMNKKKKKKKIETEKNTKENTEENTEKEILYLKTIKKLGYLQDKITIFNKEMTSKINSKYKEFAIKKKIFQKENTENEMHEICILLVEIIKKVPQNLDNNQISSYIPLIDLAEFVEIYMVFYTKKIFNDFLQIIYHQMIRIQTFNKLHMLLPYVFKNKSEDFYTKMNNEIKENVEKLTKSIEIIEEHINYFVKYKFTS